MPAHLPRLALALLVLLSLPACQSAPPPAARAIGGDWSEPVNGVRMGVRQIISSSADGGIWLLVLVENTNSQEVGWPGIITEPDVQFFGRPPGDSSTSGENLRIVAEPLEGQPTADSAQFLMIRELRQIDTLVPGEIRLYAIRLQDDELQQRMMLQQAPNQVESYSVEWSGLNEEAAEGRWRIHLTDRPERFPRPPGAEHLYEGIAYEVHGWEGRQIDLPPVTVEVLPHGMSQSRQEMRGR